MTKPKTAEESGLPPHWKVRILIKGAGIIHVISRTEPEITGFDNAIGEIDMDPINDTNHGDTIGFMNWSEVTAVTWRKA